MRETKFIQQNQEKWARFEQILSEKSRDPEELNDLFVQITDDLSYARTFYPSRSVRAYLNGLAQRVYAMVYRQKRSPWSRIRHFFVAELPQIVYESRRSFLLAALFFILSFVVGYFSSLMDHDFPKAILGDAYVNMTAENIKSGDPMKVYSSSGHFDMTFSIMANNIFVTLFCFLVGIFAGVGSVAFMMYNGVMLGAFLQFFAQNHLLKEANLTVWMHGTLEISAIIIGTAAGLEMGRGLVFPSTYHRLESFQVGARRGLKILAGVLLMLVLAALVEGNLTRETKVGDVFRAIFIGFSLFSIFFYYVWYPFYLSKKGFPPPPPQLPDWSPPAYEPDWEEVKTSGEIFTDVFFQIKKHIGYYLARVAGASALFCAYAFLAGNHGPDDIFKLGGGGVQQPIYRLLYSIFTEWQVLGQFFVNKYIPFLPALNAVCFTWLAFGVYRKVAEEEKGVSFNWKTQILLFIRLFSICGVFFALCALDSSALVLGLFLFFPWLGVAMYICFREDKGPFRAVGRAWTLVSGSAGLALGAYYLLLLISYLFFSFVNSIFVEYYLQVVGWNTRLTQAALDNFAVILTAYISIFALFSIFTLLFAGFPFLYYSLREIKEAHGMMKKIMRVGMDKKIRGLLQENGRE